jgi:hypothetical protein
MNSKLSRRTVLRGMGAAVALPMLEAMLPLSALAQSAPKRKIVRMAYLFVPNGINMSEWTPAQEGANFTLPSTLQPLANVRNSVSILTGLTQQNASALGDGPGDHARSAAAWLTGVHPRKTSGADIHNGISIDQLAAAHIGDQTPFSSLEIGCERGGTNGDCDSGYSCAYSANISWRGPASPMAKEIDPRQVFDRLFGSEDAQESAKNRLMRNSDRQSILDFVMDDAASLKNRLGSRDRDKLDEYLTGIRDIEQRLHRTARVQQAASISGVTAPSYMPEDYGEHLRIMSDMMVLAFQADLTRICTFMWANEGSNRSFSNIGIPEGHHELSHHGGIPDKLQKLAKINHFQVSQLAYLLEKLQSIDEHDGTLLDNSMIVFGGGISDGDRHNHDDLPVLLAGRGGGTIHSGRHLVYKDYTPMANLYLSMLDRVGIRTDKFGDSSGRLQMLF